jgi:hypothetical protein
MQEHDVQMIEECQKHLNCKHYRSTMTMAPPAEADAADGTTDTFRKLLT